MVKLVFDDDDDDFGGFGFGKDFGKGFGGFKMGGFDDDDFGFGGSNFGGNFGGMGQCTSIKKTTQIINGKKITKTETTTIDSQGNKKTVIKEETGDGQVREYLLGEDGKKIDRKKIGDYDEDEYEESYHHRSHGNHGKTKKTTKKRYLNKKK